MVVGGAGRLVGSKLAGRQTTKQVLVDCGGRAWQAGKLAGWLLFVVVFVGLAGWSRLAGWQAGRLAGWQAGRLAGRLAGWQAGRLAGWQAGWQAGRLANWLVWQVGSQGLAGWQAGRPGRLAGWQAGRLAW